MAELSGAAVLSRRAGRRFVAAVATIFGASGMSLANWFPRIPETRAQLNLSYDELGVALFGIGGGAMLSMPATGWLISRVGSCVVTRIAALGMCAALPFIALASNLIQLAVTLFMFGMLSGALDVAMNAQAAYGEGRVGRRFLSMLHGVFSIGTVLGAGIAAAASAAGIPLATHLAGVAVLLAAAVAVAILFLLPDQDTVRAGAAATSPHLALPMGAIWWLGIIAFCALLSEGAIGDWSAVFLRDALGAGPRLAALGFGAFALTMTAGRLVGDPVVARFGAVRVLRVCGLLAAVGMVLTLAGPGPFSAIAGLALVGAGISVVFPVVVRAASHSRAMTAGAAIAAVSTAGYTGFLAGPPAIGLLSEVAGLRWGLAVLLVLALAIVMLAGHGRSADGDGPRRHHAG